METELKFSSYLRKSKPEENGSTTDESHDDHQSSYSKSLPSRAANGFTGDPASHTDRTQSEPMALNGNDLTTSASDTDESVAESQSALKPKPKLGRIGGKGKDKPPEAPAISTPKRKIGKIGGKGKPANVSHTASVTGQDEGRAPDMQEDAISPNSDEKNQVAGPKPIGSERRSRLVQKRSEPSPPRETSQERANKKREQLKRELENKSQVAIKKKRRF